MEKKMSKKDKDTTDTGNSVFPAKWAKKLPSGWSEEADSLSLDDLKKKLVEFERTISSTEKDMENDGKLLDLKKETKEVGDQYKDIIDAHRAMIKYLVYIIDSRGTP